MKTHVVEVIKKNGMATLPLHQVFANLTPCNREYSKIINFVRRAKVISLNAVNFFKLFLIRVKLFSTYIICPPFYLTKMILDILFHKLTFLGQLSGFLHIQIVSPEQVSPDNWSLSIHLCLNILPLYL